MCLRILILTVTLAFVLVNYPNSSAQSPPPLTSDDIRRLKESTALVARILKNQQLGFDPKVLMEVGWRKKLASVFEKMPELKQSIRPTEALNGVYIGDTLLLPERIRLVGDTVILVHQIAPMDENVDVEIIGNSALFIFTIGVPTKRLRLMRQAGVQGTLRIYTNGRCHFTGQEMLFSRQHFSC